jgi:hypothetical protein
VRGVFRSRRPVGRQRGSAYGPPVGTVFWIDVPPACFLGRTSKTLVGEENLEPHRHHTAIDHACGDEKEWLRWSVGSPIALRVSLYYLLSSTFVQLTEFPSRCKFIFVGQM